MTTTINRWLAISVLLISSAAAAPSATTSLAVDVVTLKSGPALRGLILPGPAEEPLTIAVSRVWLQKANPTLLEKAAAAEHEAEQQAWDALRDRLQPLVDAAGDDVTPLIAFWKSELRRAEEELGKADRQATHPFVWVDVPRVLVQRMTNASPDHLRTAIWAWHQNVPQVESTSFAELQKELTRRQINPTQTPPAEFATRFAPRVQDDAEWAARRALIEYGLGQGLELQGTGDVVLPSDASRDAATMAPLIAKMLQTQVNSLLKDLDALGGPALNPPASTKRQPAWWDSATQLAESRSRTGFRVTTVDVLLEQQQVVIESRFVARAADRWQTIWSRRSTEDLSKPRREAEDRIRNDPTFKKALASIQALGLGDTGAIDQAIRCGAATQAGQQQMTGAFQSDLDRYLQHTDGPPLRWARE